GLSLGWQLYRARSQRRKGRRVAGSAVHESRDVPQSQDCQGARHHGAAAIARPRRRGDRVKRREFITLIVGAAAAWPLAAHAPHCERMRRIGVLTSLAAHGTQAHARCAAFMQGLQQLGWIDGRNVQIDTRWGAGDADRTRRYAAELVALAPDVILATGSPPVIALQQVTRSAAIVFADVGDPVGQGFVETLARPGGNTTGFMLFEYAMGGKWLELLKEIAPGVTRAAVLRDTAATVAGGQLGAIQAAAASLGVELSPVGMRDAGEIERGISTFARS